MTQEAYPTQGVIFSVKTAEVYTPVAKIDNVKLPEVTSKVAEYVTHDNLTTRYLATGLKMTGEGELVLIYDGADPFLAKVGDSLDVQITYKSGDICTFTMLVTKWALSDSDLGATEPLKATVGFQPASLPIWS
jgi:hypothetical protein